MSKDVVKSEKPGEVVLPLAAVGKLSSDFHVIVPVLSANSPMPLDFSATWSAAWWQLKEALYKNKREAALRISKALNLRVTGANKLACWLNTRKRTASFIAGSSVGVIMLGTGVAGLLYGFDSVTTNGSPMFLFGTISSVFFAILPGFVAQEIPVDLEDKFFIPVLNSFETGYEQCVAQWAQERYGVTIPAGAWAGPSDRVSKDIVYLGVKDGEGIYCQQHEEGWVLTYKDGTELPVLVEQKELVEA